VPEPEDEESLPGAEQPYPEVKEVVISTNKPEVVDFFEGKTTPVKIEPDKTLRDRLLETAEAQYLSFGRLKMDPTQRALCEEIIALKDERGQLKREIDTLKNDVMRLAMTICRINSKVVFEIAKTTETLLSSGPVFPVTDVRKKDILLAFENLQSTLSSVLVNPV